MTREAKQFMFGLNQCRKDGGMKWHGKMPQDIVDLFDIKVEETKQGYDILGVYVTLVPQYEQFKPEWKE